MANLTATCPELAPEGWKLYVAYGVPVPAVGEFDEEAEVQATLDDLRDQFRDFEDRGERFRALAGDVARFAQKEAS